MTPFLPGLILALAAWILPLAVRFCPQPILSPVIARVPRLPGLAPWIHSIALPYLGLLMGWIAGRDYGLSGHTLAEWIVGSVAAVLLGIILGRASVRFSPPRGWGDVRDEARWSLFRAAAWPWVGYLPIAVAAGWLASLAEFAWDRRPGGENFFGAQGIAFLIRTTGSAILFLLAHNFYLSMLYYLTAVLASTPDIRSRFYEALDRLRKKI